MKEGHTWETLGRYAMCYVYTAYVSYFKQLQCKSTVIYVLGLYGSAERSGRRADETEGIDQQTRVLSGQGLNIVNCVLCYLLCVN